MILHEGTVVADDSPARLRELANVPSLEDVFAKLAVRQDLDAMAGRADRDGPIVTITTSSRAFARRSPPASAVRGCATIAGASAARSARPTATTRYWARPVAGFGDPAARIASSGSLRRPTAPTGRDATSPETASAVRAISSWPPSTPTAWRISRSSRSPDDGLTLKNAWIAAAVRCAPPDNMPTPAEIAACQPHLVAELAALPNLRVYVALGRIAYDAVLADSLQSGWAAATKNDVSPSVWSWSSLSNSRWPRRHRGVPSQPPEHEYGQAHAADAPTGLPACGEGCDE